MLDLKVVQNSPELVAQALKNRNSDIQVSDFTALDERRRAALARLESLQSERNKASGEVARIKRRADAHQRRDARTRHAEAVRCGGQQGGGRGEGVAEQVWADRHGLRQRRAVARNQPPG